MVHKATELFAQFVYSLELSYHSLLERETELKAAVAGIWEQHGGEFIHFEEMGDTMRAQCSFVDYAEELFHDICEAVAHYMDSFVEARLVFINKNLETLHIYTISNYSWQECCLRLPDTGPLGLALLERDSQ
jgi:hypothetical protein